MRRSVAALTAVALLVAGACSGGGGDDPAPDGSPDGGDDPLAASCEPLMRFLGVRTAQAVSRVPQDPRLSLAALSSVQPLETASAAELAEWSDWVARQESVLYGNNLLVLDVPQAHADLMTECRVNGYEFDTFDVSVDDPDLPPFAAPPEGGIEVVEQGVQAMTDSADGDMASFGVIVENTSDLVAVAVEVTLTPVDGAGQSVRDTDGGETYVVPVLAPGERYGIGDTRYADRPGVAAVEVAVVDAGDARTTTQWWPTDHELIAFPDITVEPPTMVRADNGTYTLELTYESGYPVELPSRYAHAIFRNGDGQIVGGTSDIAVVRPGRGFGELYSNYGVPGVDDARTEAYL